MIINVAITVCNEHVELNNLLFMVNAIKVNTPINIKIYIQADKQKVTQDVIDVVSKYHNSIEDYVEFPFSGDFSEFKNNLFNVCGEGYIYQLDADELPNHVQFMYLHEVLKKDPNIDLVFVPRVNIVNGIEESDIEKWGWRYQEMWGKKLINFPDYQGRIYKNEDYLRWEGKVHERITGYYKPYKLPESLEVSISHIKTIDKQRYQNNFYDKL